MVTVRKGYILYFKSVKLLNILFIHKYLNFNLLSDLCDTFNFVYIDHNYATRNRTMGLLKLPLVSTTTYYGLQTLSYQAVSQWNSLQQLNSDTLLADMSLSSLKSFVTSELRRHYIDNN